MAKHRTPLPTAEEKTARRREARMEKTKKIAIAVGAVALAVAAFFIYSSFFGNPFAKTAAKSDIEAHIAQYLPTLDLEISPLKYDRESKSFYAMVTSNTSEDTYFTVYCRAGECTDYYEDSVENLFNTIERFEKAFSDTAKTALLEKGLVSQDSKVSVSAASFLDARDSGEFSVDMPVTADLESDFAVHAALEKTASVASLAETITALHNGLVGADLPDIVLYNVTLTDGEKTATAYNVTVDDVTGGELEKVLQNALDDPFDAFNDLENENPLTVSVQ